MLLEIQTNNNLSIFSDNFILLNITITIYYRSGYKNILDAHNYTIVIIPHFSLKTIEQGRDDYSITLFIGHSKFGLKQK